MRLDLRRIWVPLDAHLLNESTGDVDPVLLRERHLMSVEVASGAIELAFGHDSLQVFDLKLQTIGVICDFLAHG